MILKLCILSFQINGLWNKGGERKTDFLIKGGGNALYHKNKHTNGFWSQIK